MLSRLARKLPLALFPALMATALFASVAFGQDEGISNAELAYAIDNIALMICAVLVFTMQAGFALVEVGFNSEKNVVNIWFKNIVDLLAGVLVFWLVGFSLMYGATSLGSFVGWGGFGIPTTPPDPASGLNPYVNFFFQAVFAATAATIVSGAVAGRMKLPAYVIYTIFITAIIYPISGHWQWGGGWLAQMGFHDFAGSLVVHSVGGFAGLAGIIVLGPRIGRFSRNAPANAFAPHNIVFAGLGVFILWAGWYGFNPGSVLAFAGASNTDLVMLVAANTTLAAAAGGIIALAYSWIVNRQPDLGFTLNGTLGGLVAITAGADVVTINSALIIGLVGGLLVVGGTILLEKLKLDDTVGAWPVHGLAGIWAGIATGIFGAYEGSSLGVQILGSLVIPLWSFTMAFALFQVLKLTNNLRVSPEEEEVGLDLTEHGTRAYTTTSLGGVSAD